MFCHEKVRRDVSVITTEKTCHGRVVWGPPFQHHSDVSLFFEWERIRTATLPFSLWVHKNECNEGIHVINSVSVGGRKEKESGGEEKAYCKCALPLCNVQCLSASCDSVSTQSCGWWLLRGLCNVCNRGLATGAQEEGAQKAENHCWTLISPGNSHSHHFIAFSQQRATSLRSVSFVTYRSTVEVVFFLHIFSLIFHSGILM